MLKVLIHGAGGKMGRVVAAAVAGKPDMQVVAGVDPRGGEAAFPIFTSLDACDITADVIIDFSTAAAIPALLDYCAETKTPAVLCTTGLSEEMNWRIAEVSKAVALFKSANMSLGINLLVTLLQKAAPVLAEAGFDIEIVEKHHNQKIDAPSGTALMLANAVNAALPEDYTYVYDRSQVRQKRSRTEIGIHAVRGGTIVGEHDVMFAGQDEVLTLSHHAASKEVFATGAVKAAAFLAGKPAGLYDMSDVLK